MTNYRIGLIVAAVACAAGALVPRAMATEPKRQKHEYGTAAEMLAAVPAELKPLPGTKWTDVQREAVNAKLKELVLGQPASLGFKVDKVENGSGGMKSVVAEHIKVAGLETRQSAQFTAEKVPTLARVKVDETVRVEGTISKCVVWYDKKSGHTIYDVVITDSTLPNK